jgi:hypothetical protein
MMRKCLGLLIMALFVMVCFAAPQALANNYPTYDPWWNQDYEWCPDPYDDSAGGYKFEIYKIGHVIENGKLYVAVKTEFPKEGVYGSDSYSSYTKFSPGDLYLNVGGMFQMGTGTVYGIGTTDHSGDMTRDPSDGPWENVNYGKLYTNANFASGTYEKYATGTPTDGNDGDMLNNYPTLIESYDQCVSGVSGFKYKDLSDYNYYYYWVDLAALGLEWCEEGLSQTLQITWAMECGNDLAECKIDACEPEVPEPTTVALIGAGVMALSGRRRWRF